MSVESIQGSPTVKGMYQLFLGNTTYTLLLAVTAIVVGRILGPDRYGLYTVALIVPTFLFMAVRLGFDSSFVRARMHGRGRQPRLLALSLAH